MGGLARFDPNLFVTIVMDTRSLWSNRVQVLLIPHFTPDAKNQLKGNS